MKNKIWIEGNAKYSKVLTLLKEELESKGYIVLDDLDDIERVDILLNCHETSERIRDVPKFHYSTIITIVPDEKATYKSVRNKRSDIYVSKVNDHYQIRNSEVFLIYMNATIEQAVTELVSQIESKLTRQYVSVVPDESPKDLTSCLSDNRKSRLLLKLDKCTSVSIKTQNRPHNGLSTLMIYRNVKFSQTYPTLISYFDNVNGIIRYSLSDKERKRVKVPLDLIAHQAIHQALSVIGDAVVMFNQYNLLDETYTFGENILIIDTFPINSVEYFKELAISVSKNIECDKELNILVPNRGVFQIIPLALDDKEIVSKVYEKRQSKTWDEIIYSEV